MGWAPAAASNMDPATASSRSQGIERADDGGYGAWSPELPGCVALGDTPDEAVAEMREAIKDHLELLRVRGEPIPAATAVRVDLASAA